MLTAIIVALVLLLDQISKILTDLYLMPLGTTLPLWDGVFHLTSAHNTGAAFGMLPGAKWFFIIITLAACGMILYLIYKDRKRMSLLMRIAFALLLGGALGNLIDRVLLGYVRDMFDFRLINFAIFNVADAAVCVGVGMLLIDILFLNGKVILEPASKQKADVQELDAPLPEKTDEDKEPAGQDEEDMGGIHRS